MRRGALERARLRLRDAAALLGFVRRRRSIWLAILVALLLLLALLLYLAQAAAVSPFVYPLF